MKQSGCDVQEWMLNRTKKHTGGYKIQPAPIDTTPSYDKKKRHKKQQIIKHNKSKKHALLTRDASA
jgi:hypothetical protein